MQSRDVSQCGHAGYPFGGSSVPKLPSIKCADAHRSAHVIWRDIRLQRWTDTWSSTALPTSMAMMGGHATVVPYLYPLRHLLIHMSAVYHMFGRLFGRKWICSRSPCGAPQIARSLCINVVCVRGPRVSTSFPGRVHCRCGSDVKGIPSHPQSDCNGRATTATVRHPLAITSSWVHTRCHIRVALHHPHPTTSSMKAAILACGSKRYVCRH